MANDSLVIIAREISHLKDKKKLDYADTKRLEILIKMQRLILNTPTEIIQIEDQVYTDLEVLRRIEKDKKEKEKQLKARQKAAKKKKLTKKKVTKKKATSNGKKKKASPRAKSSS